MSYPNVGIGVLILNRRHLLLGKRHRTHSAFIWATPSGHLEFGETFEQCAIREVNEETDLIISNPKFVEITSDIFTEESKHYVSIFLSTAYLDTQKIINLEHNKVHSWEWFDIKRLPESLFCPLRNLIEAKGNEFLSCLCG